MSYRPASGYRPSSGFRRPGTGFRPSSRGTTALGYRPQTGFRRLDTATGAAPKPGSTVGLETNVQIHARPVTQHGLSGMKTASVGGGSSRKVADRSYYENQLRSHITAIFNEIQSMQQQIQGHEQNKKQMVQLEKDRDVVSKELHELEGKLADYNLALDKMRSGAEISHLQSSIAELQNRNAQEKKQVDAIFLERKQLEEQITSIQNEIQHIHQSTEHKLSQFPELREQYHALLVKSKQIQKISAERQRALAEVQHKYHQIREALESDQYSNNLKAVNLQRRLQQLSMRKNELQEETNGSLNPEQIKQKILERVKEDNRILSETNARMTAMEEKIEHLHSELSEKEHDLETMKLYAAEADKYEALFEKDKKMQQFIDEFQQNIKTIHQSKHELQEDISGLMEHISAQISAKKLSDKEIQQVQSDTDRKESLPATLEELESEHEKRKSEMEKMTALDQKIQLEMASMEEKEMEMKHEMDNFKTADEIKEEYIQNKKELFKTKMETQQSKEAKEKQLSKLTEEMDSICNELADNKQHLELEQLETEIENLQQNISTIEETIAEHKKETDYENLLQDVLMLSKQINGLIITQVAMET